MSKIKKIKESITEVEYKKLMTFVRGDEIMREHTKKNLLRTFTFLYFTGLRLNEVQEIRISNIKDLLDTGTTKIYVSKTKSERKLFITSAFKKELMKLFDFSIEEDQHLIVSKGAIKTKQTKINTIVFIQQVNSIMKNILGDGFTSHSFRQGIITEMGSKSINVKIISKFIGHKNVGTTMGYMKPTDEDIVNSLIR